MAQNNSVFFKESLLGGLTASLVAAILVLITAVAGRFLPMSDTLIQVLNLVIKGIAVIIGVLTQIKTCEKGLFKGIVIGVIFTAVSLVLFLSLGGGFTLTSLLIDLAIGVVFGGLTGILAVNRRAQRG